MIHLSFEVFQLGYRVNLEKWKRMKMKILLMVFAISHGVAPQSSVPNSIVLDLTNSTIRVQEKQGICDFLVHVEGEQRQVQVEAEVLDADGKVIDQSHNKVTVQPGPQTIEVPLNHIPPLTYDLAWNRLKISIKDQEHTHEEIISLGNIAPDAAVIYVECPSYVFNPDQEVFIQAHVLHPFTGTPIQDAVLTLSDPENRIGKQTAYTSKDGKAQFLVRLPNSDELGMELRLFAQKGLFVAEEEVKIEIFDDIHAHVVTDKPLYQPGQTVYFRVVVANRHRRMLDNLPLSCTLKDRSGSIFYDQVLHTSKYGIAHGEWNIPEKIELGVFDIDIDSEDEAIDLQWVGNTFRVSRYELPNLMAQTNPDKTFYLPGERPKIKIHIQTMSGQPIYDAGVQIFNKPHRYRYSNYFETKMDIESPLWSGRTDIRGKAHAELDLQDAFTILTNSSGWRKFQDQEFVVIATDPITGEAAHSYFTLRATQEPVHVYLNPERVDEGLPVVCWFTTFLADGSPLAADLESSSTTKPSYLAGIHTNRYGIARCEIPYDEFLALRKVTVTATDKTGRSGQLDWESNSYFDEGLGLQIRSNTIFYDEGQPIKLSLASTKQEGDIRVTVATEFGPSKRLNVSLIDGKAELSIPFEPDFCGEVVISARHEPKGKEWLDAIIYGLEEATCSVMFPGETMLDLNLAVEPAVVRPGESAMIHLRTQGKKGEPSAIGLTVIDTAVEALLAESGNPDAVSYFRRESEYLFPQDETYAGFSRSDLKHWPKALMTSDLALVAEYLLSRDYYGSWVRLFGSSPVETCSDRYRNACKTTVEAVVPKIDQLIERASFHTMTELDVKNYFDTYWLAELTDPWGNHFRWEVLLEGKNYRLIYTSSGCDGEFNEDDYGDDIQIIAKQWSWFSNAHSELKAFLKEWTSTSSPDGPNASKLRAAWDESGIQMFDPFGNQLFLEIHESGTKLLVSVISHGLEGSQDRIRLFKTHIDTFRSVKDQLFHILDQEDISSVKTPEMVEELIRSHGITNEHLTDLHGNPIFLELQEWVHYSDKTQVIQKGEGAFLSQPVRLLHPQIKFYSAGPDGERGTSDDQLAYIFTGRPIEIIDMDQAVPGQETSETYWFISKDRLEFGDNLGNIKGIVSSGSDILPGVVVMLEGEELQGLKTVVTDSEGRFNFLLPPGFYTITFTLAGFRSVRVTSIQVLANSVTQMATSLTMAFLEETISVCAEAPPAETGSSPTAMAVNQDKEGASTPRHSATFDETPRLRKDFRETLLWEPEIITSPDGTAQVPFNLSDNVTTWKIQAVAHTLDGRFTTAETTFAAKLPFFAQFDPPPRLTSGDFVALPVAIRNFSSSPQQVRISLDSSHPSLKVQDSPSHSVNIETGMAELATFDVQAESFQKGVKLNVQAIGSNDQDAVQKTVEIAPYGRYVSRSIGTILKNQATVDVDIPADVIDGTVTTELRIFPNISVQLERAMRSLLEKPTGCSEQITSTAWINLLYLVNADEANMDHTIQNAEKNVGYAKNRLLDRQTPEGGMSYWSRENPEVILTAYVLRFLSQLESQIEQGPGFQSASIQRLLRYLANAQKENGSWEDESADNQIIQDTAYVARSLAEVLKYDQNSIQTIQEMVGKALTFLKPQVTRFGEPYALANYAIAAFYVEDFAEFEKACDQLSELAIEEGAAAYWGINRNTPLFGWGLPGRLESTSVAILALSLSQYAERELLDAGRLYLLKNRDSASIWYSTATTVAVFEALLALDSGGKEPEGDIEIHVNGKYAQTYDLAKAKQGEGLLPLELTEYVSPGTNNQVQLRRKGGDTAAQVDTVVEYFVPWDEDKPKESSHENLSFSVDYDRTSLKRGETVTCTVKAQRRYLRGRGMMLAEVGIPPGAEVDRLMLENEMGNHAFDVQPDRIILYLWPRAAGNTVKFCFRTNLQGNMMAPSSVLYDYYNPEARVDIKPVRFSIL